DWAAAERPRAGSGGGAGGGEAKKNGIGGLMRGGGLCYLCVRCGRRPNTPFALLRTRDGDPTMLVLSRRPEEKIVFPQSGVVVHVLGVRGNSVRIGVEAPREVKVLRDELSATPAPTPALKRSPSHALLNRLNKVALLTHLLEKQWDAGRTDEARATLRKLAEVVDTLGGAWVK